MKYEKTTSKEIQEEQNNVPAITIKYDSDEKRFYVYQQGREIASIPQDNECAMREVFRDFQHVTIFAKLRLLPLIAKYIGNDGRKVEIWTRTQTARIMPK